MHGERVKKKRHAEFTDIWSIFMQDAGGSLALNVMMEDSPPLFPDIGPVFNTSASECMRQHLSDTLEFLADFHTLSRLKVCSINS